MPTFCFSFHPLILTTYLMLNKVIYFGAMVLSSTRVWQGFLNTTAPYR